MNEPKKTEKPNTKKPGNLRQWILIGILLIVTVAFFYDRNVLMPSANEKIDKVINEIALTISAKNRKQVHDLIGRKPASTFTYKEFEVEQYRFPRGLPGFKRPVLDIAYQEDAIAFFRQDGAIDNAYIDSQRSTTIIDRTLPGGDLGEPVVRGGG